MTPGPITRSPSCGALLAVIAVAAFAGSASGQGLRVPVSLQVPLLSNVLTFDRSLRDRGGSELTVLVGYQENYGPSRDFRDEVEEYLRHNEGGLVHRKRVRWEFVDVSSPAALLAECAARGAAVLYLGPLRAVDIGDLSSRAAASGTLVVGSMPEYVEDGVAVAFGLTGGRPSILINVGAAEAAGADFGSQLLQIAELVRR